MLEGMQLQEAHAQAKGSDTLILLESVVHREKDSRARESPETLIVGFVFVSMVIQGGFSNFVTCLFGVVVCAVAGLGALRRKRRKDRVLLVPVLFFGVACCCLLGALANGLTLTTLSETGAWFGVAGMAALAGSQAPEQRERTVTLLSWTGIASAVLGMFVFFGILPFPGGMNDGRLQFFFQYANAAGIWFAAIAALCLLSSNGWLRAFATMPLLALLLTQSGGAILVSLAACFVGAVRWCRTRQFARLMLSTCQAIAALAMFVCAQLMQGAIGLVLLAAAIGFCFAFRLADKRFPDFRHQKPAALVSIGITALASAVTLAFFPNRVWTAVASLIERLYHIADGVALWTGSPLLGIGPDNWQYLYPYSQTAQYHTTVVHSSYVQAALDSGLVGLAALICAIAIGVIALLRADRRGSGTAAAAAAVLIAVHSLIDFDLQFGAIAFFLAFLLSTSQGPTLPAKNLWAGLALAVLGTSACFVGTLAEVSKTGFSLANATGDYSQVLELFDGSPLAKGDVSAQTQYVVALYGAGDRERIGTFLEEQGASTDEQAIYLAAALYESGEDEKAGELLIEQMELQPYNDEFYRNVKSLIDMYGLSENLKIRYNAAVANANRLVAESSKPLSTQETLDTYIN